MSTIASPRDPPAFRRTPSSQAIITPTSSARPSIDLSSTTTSPNTQHVPQPPSSQVTSSKRTARAALREYYNLKSVTNKPLPATPTVEVTQPLSPAVGFHSELDAPGFDPAAYVSNLVSTASLAELLSAYTRVASEMRALDAERKGLVYDNYSRLIGATEMIRKMRRATEGEGEEGDEEGWKKLQEVVGEVYSLAEKVRTEAGLGRSAGGDQTEDEEQKRRRERTRELAREVVRAVGRVKKLVREGRVEEAKKEWEMPRRLLVKWKEMGVGGEDVGGLLEDGDAALRQENGENREKEGQSTSETEEKSEETQSAKGGQR